MARVNVPRGGVVGALRDQFLGNIGLQDPTVNVPKLTPPLTLDPIVGQSASNELPILDPITGRVIFGQPPLEIKDDPPLETKPVIPGAQPPILLPPDQQQTPNTVIPEQKTGGIQQPVIPQNTPGQINISPSTKTIPITRRNRFRDGFVSPTKFPPMNLQEQSTNFQRLPDNFTQTDLDYIRAVRRNAFKSLI